MEYLTRGLVAAQTADGIFLSWRFLGDEPDGISWNVYRKDGDADFVKITTIAPRNVQPESDYDTNPGIVKENVTPSNYTDPDGVLTSVYEVAPVVGGVEGRRQGMSVPMLSALPGQAGQANRGAATYIPLKPAPAPVPLAHFTYRGQRFGPGTNLNAADMVVPGTGNQNWYVVDMNLLRGFRVAYHDQATVTQEQLDGWVAKLNEYNTTPNALGVATYPSARPLTNSLVDGKITRALYDELEAEFVTYVKNLDSGTSLPYAKTSAGAVHTSQSSAYATHDITVADFDGDGEYEIVVKWRSTQQDPMYSEPIFNGSNTTTAPEYVDAYKLDGTLLFRVDMGYNVRAGNDHETTLFAEDFDGDGKAELMLKTALGTRIGNWDEASQSVVYPDTRNTVVGGEDGLHATTDRFKEYFATGDTAALDTYWSLLNSFAISYRSPVAGNGNDGVNDPAVKRWIKTYHVGPIGPAKDDQEFFSAFEWDAGAGRGVLVDSARYPFTYRGSVDGDNWAMTPATQRGNFSYLAFPGPGAGSGPADYKSQMMAPSEAYWLENPWKAASWGDAQGNRANRYLGVVAALDGKHTYAVSQRGYYARTTFAAFTLVDGKVRLKASFDSADPRYWSLGGTAYDYQNRGNHFTDSADLDGDGRDEIVMKAMVLGLNADGTKILPKVINGDTMPTIEGQNSVPPVANSFEFATDAVRTNPLNTWAPLRHGDRSALLPVDKDNNIRVWSGSEENLYDDIRTGRQHGWLPGPEAHDPLKGMRRDDRGEVVRENSMVFGVYAGTDAEGAVAGNFSNRWPGAQGFSQNGARSMVTGELLNGSNNLRSGQYAIWFGGGLTAMAVSGATISTVDDLTFAPTPYLATGLTSTGNKSTPTLKADLLGDWREELVLRASDNRLAIVTTLSPTEYGIRTLMHDPMYRNGVANKNTGYDQFGFASFYLGDEARLPSMRTDIAVPAGPDTTAPTVTVKPESKGRDGVYRDVSFRLADAGKVDRLTLNGVGKDLADNTWSDLNGVKPGAFGGKAGSNELKVYDVAGNVTTLTFTLDVTGPTVTVKDGATETVGTPATGYEQVSFKLFDEYRVDRLSLNGVGKDLTDNAWSDLNGVRLGVSGAVLGANELTVYDVAGNVTTLAFTLVAPSPAAPAWDPKQAYRTGDRVSHDGAVYVAQWWTQNEKPGSTPTGSWMEQGAPVPAAGADVRSWTPSWVYPGGEVVEHDGHTWKARWWSRDQQPGEPNGPWQDLGAY
ncbi:carbohydrate-binding protein [Plantactinospora sp. B5E13]|uniref:rhamnogalacturonan lyase family protein n=1 Tax=Plantactinospora sp. B5E13 TaxID=3153758 RepID=UPI00325CB9CC